MVEPLNFDHPSDVLQFVSDAQNAGTRCALVAVTDTMGGSSRAPGALMGITEDGRSAGYVSNGCVDGDLIANAKEAIACDTARTLKYGRGSPFLDIQLPCGGSIDLILAPNPPQSVIQAALHHSAHRQAFCLDFPRVGKLKISTPHETTSAWAGDIFKAYCRPKLRMRIAGHGAEALALAQLSLASGYEVHLLSPDELTLSRAKSMGAHNVIHLEKTSDIDGSKDDFCTAFVMMFHDHSWEFSLLKDALEGDAFYIGALGSQITHAKRLETLLSGGIAHESAERVRGPIGLVLSLRDASSVAISTLAEIISVFGERYR